MRNLLRILLITLLLFLSAQPVSAQWSEPAEKERSEPVAGIKRIGMLGADIRGACILPTLRNASIRDLIQMQDAKPSYAAGAIHLKYGFSYTPASDRGRIYPGVWQGIGAGVEMLDNPKDLGTPVTLYFFQGAPVWRINRRLSLFYEWNFGASFGWKPCSDYIARSRVLVGSRVNAYIDLGAGLSWKINPALSLTAGLEIVHFSNGNTSFPNPGVNMIALRFGVNHNLDGRRNGKQDKSPVISSGAPYNYYYANEDSRDTIRHKIGYDVTFYGAWRNRIYEAGGKTGLMKGHYGVAGFSFSPMWRIAPIFRAGMSADFQWDESTNMKRHHIGDDPGDISFTRPRDPLTQVCAGVAARAELVMPFFSVNVGTGYNFIGPKETRATYQMVNLKLYIYKGLYLNAGYQLLNFFKENNLMLGVGYSFR